MKTTKLILVSSLLAFAGLSPALAQNSTSDTNLTTTQTRDMDDYGARTGDWEFTLGGSGTSNKQLDDSLGGLNFSVGYFLTDTLEVAARQTVNYSNPAGGGGARYDASTFIAVDQHFGTGRLRPFVGLNVGSLYGDNTSDTWAAGIEGGLKFYVLPKTFLFAIADYAWSFEGSKSPTKNFNDGAFSWSVGVGFNL
jgi:hypothetical protein